MQNYCILIRAHLRGLGANFPNKKCSLERVINSVQISSPHLLLSRYSRLKMPFYNRFPMENTHVEINRFPMENTMWVSPRNIFCLENWTASPLRCAKIRIEGPELLYGRPSTTETGGGSVN